MLLSLFVFHAAFSSNVDVKRTSRLDRYETYYSIKFTGLLFIY